MILDSEFFIEIVFGAEECVIFSEVVVVGRDVSFVVVAGGSGGDVLFE